MNTPIKYIDINNGDEAIFNTVRIMSGVINESSINYKVRKFAESILEDKYSGHFNEHNIVNIIYQYIIKNTKYLYDINGVELIKSPLLIIDEIEAGHKPLLDCDDYTVFSLSLLKSVGFSVAIRIISANGTKDYDHVYGLVKVKGEWIPLDCTLNKGVGLEYTNPKRIADYEVLTLSNKLFSGLSDMLNDNDMMYIDETYTFTVNIDQWFYQSHPDVEELKVFMGLSNIKSLLRIDRPVTTNDYTFYIIPKLSKSASFFKQKFIEGLKSQGFNFNEASVIIEGGRIEPKTIAQKVISTVTSIPESLASLISKPLYPLAIIAGSIAAIYVFMNIRAFSLPSSK